MGSCWKERNLDTAQHPYKTEVTAYIIIRQDSATSTDMGWDTVTANKFSLKFW